MVFDSHPPGPPRPRTGGVPEPRRLPRLRDVVVRRLPGRRRARAAARRRVGPAASPERPAAAGRDLAASLPHGTTIVAAAFERRRGDGRRPAGHRGQHDLPAGHREGVPQPTSSPAWPSPGVAGIGIDLVRLFAVELEHYEKLEGRALSLEGKANRLASMVRGNLGGAMQGLVVVPLFAGLDEDTGAGPDLQLRRGRRPVRGAPVPRHRVRLGVRPRLAEEALRRRDVRRRRDPGLHAGAVRRGRRRLGHRRPGPDPAASSRWWPRSPRTASGGCPTRSRGSTRAPWSARGCKPPTGRWRRCGRARHRPASPRPPPDRPAHTSKGIQRCPCRSTCRQNRR